MGINKESFIVVANKNELDLVGSHTLTTLKMLAVRDKMELAAVIQTFTNRNNKLIMKRVSVTLDGRTIDQVNVADIIATFFHGVPNNWIFICPEFTDKNVVEEIFDKLRHVPKPYNITSINCQLAELLKSEVDKKGFTTVVMRSIAAMVQNASNTEVFNRRVK